MTPLRPLRRFFVPSRAFGRYLARAFFLRFLAFVIGVTLVLQMLDLLDQIDDIMAGAGNDNAAIWRYLSLRLPELLSRFIPFSALLAAILTLATLSRNSELTVMKASGLSAHRILLPIGMVCAGIAAVHFLFEQQVVAPARDELAFWQRHDYRGDIPPPVDSSGHVWLAEGKAIILAEAVSRSGPLVTLDNVTVYERDEQGLLRHVVRARFAHHVDGKWIRFDVRHFDLASLELRLADAEPWALDISPERFFSLAIVPEHVGFGDLLGAIARLDREGTPTGALRAALWQKIALPLATLLMPVLGAIAGFGGQRGGQIFARSAIGMALGFAFFVADNFMMAMAKLGAAPPLLAAFGPMLLFMSVGFAFLFYHEE